MSALNIKKMIIFFILLCFLSLHYAKCNENQDSSENKAAFLEMQYHEVSQNKISQDLFNKGMLFYYAYSYDQAEYNFRQGLLYDPQCALCYWGLAIAKKQQALELGKPFGSLGVSDLKKAAKLVSVANAFQYDLIQATLPSFSLDPEMSSKQLQLRYIHALRALHQKYKDNPEWREESLALFVDAIAYYSSTEDTNANPNHCGRSVDEGMKKEALSLMVPILKDPSYRDHPGLLHTYIHFTERDTEDPLGETVAQKISLFSHNLIAHYRHMANHIYWRRGMYDKAIQANYEAIAIDKNYFKKNGVGLNSYYYEYHYLHYYHFLSVLGILTNNEKLALENARAVKNLMDISCIEELKDYTDTLLSLEHLVLARFNKWEMVLQLEQPLQANELAILHIRFSKALAYLHLNQDALFQKAYEQIKETKYKNPETKELQTVILTYLKASQLRLGNASFEEIKALFIKNNIGLIEDKLTKKNPPVWFFSHVLFLSDVAFEQGIPKEAKAYRSRFEKIYPGATLHKFS